MGSEELGQLGTTPTSGHVTASSYCRSDDCSSSRGAKFDVRPVGDQEQGGEGRGGEGEGAGAGDGADRRTGGCGGEGIEGGEFGGGRSPVNVSGVRILVSATSRDYDDNNVMSSLDVNASSYQDVSSCHNVTPAANRDDVMTRVKSETVIVDINE